MCCPGVNSENYLVRCKQQVHTTSLLDSSIDPNVNHSDLVVGKTVKPLTLPLADFMVLFHALFDDASA